MRIHGHVGSLWRLPGIKSLSSGYARMQPNFCRFSKYVYEISQESEADSKVLDDPFKRSKVSET